MCGRGVLLRGGVLKGEWMEVIAEKFRYYFHSSAGSFACTYMYNSDA